MDKEEIKQKLFERLKSYCEIDSQSDPNSKTFPSTQSQRKLAKLIVDELRKIGIDDLELDRYSYVYAKIPSNISSKTKIGFIAHLDTSPAYSGKNVRVKLHRKWKGGNLVIGNGIYLDYKNCPPLKKHIGDDIITASGDTLLGADDKAGIAIIVTAAEYIIKNSLPHPEIRILFTPDEEIGKGVDKLDIKKFDCDYAFTFDGDLCGTIENETFNADSLRIDIKGRSVHPGSAKNQMANAVRIAADIISSWPENMLAETTENYDGFVMFDEIKGDVSYATIKGIVREHDMKKLRYMEALLKDIVDEKRKKYPLSDIKIEFKNQYRNMKKIIDRYPKLMEKLIDAVKEAGIEPRIKPVRGGTDGARLCFMGIPTPNIFTGGYNYHGPYEWISLDSMYKSFDVLLNLCKRF